MHAPRLLQRGDDLPPPPRLACAEPSGNGRAGQVAEGPEVELFLQPIGTISATKIGHGFAPPSPTRCSNSVEAERPREEVFQCLDACCGTG
jgi:hypothetical protein